MKFTNYLKMVLISFCVFYLFGLIFNIRMANTIFLTDKRIRNNINILKNEIKKQSPGILETIISKIEVDNDILQCPDKPPGLVGPIALNLTLMSLEDVESTDYYGIDIGGHYKPKHCIPKDKVAIIIPYRNRDMHLAVFLNNMHIFLKKHEIEYQIFVIQQSGNDIFNRAILKNIGFMVAKEINDWDCYIFHDVDLIPLDDRIIYNCPDQPRHMSAAIDKFNFILPYKELSGGVLALTTEQILTINGFSNIFWGWGGEDDEMSNRLKHHNYTLSRYPMNIARYTMLQHKSDEPSSERYQFLNSDKRQFNENGLSNLQYGVLEMRIYYTYTKFLVEIDTPNYSYDALTGLIHYFLDSIKENIF